MGRCHCDLEDSRRLYQEAWAVYRQGDTSHNFVFFTEPCTVWWKPGKLDRHSHPRPGRTYCFRIWRSSSTYSWPLLWRILETNIVLSPSHLLFSLPLLSSSSKIWWRLTILFLSQDVSLAEKQEASESPQEGASFCCLHWLRGWTAPRTVCENEKRLWGLLSQAVWKHPQPIRKFRERNGIDATNVGNTTFFPFETYSLGCRCLGCFRTETAPWISGLGRQGLRFGLESHQVPEANGEYQGTVGAVCWGLCPRGQAPVNPYWVSACSRSLV